MANKMEVFVRVSRLPFVSASAMSAIIALIWAWSVGKTVDWLSGVIGVLGVAILHLAGNAMNEYADSTNTDIINKYPTPFSGGSRAVKDGLTDIKTVLRISNGLLVAGLVLGAILVLRDKPLAIVLGFLGFLSYWLYSAKPFQLMKRGLGELVILITYGPLITWAMGYVIEKTLSWHYFLIGLPMGFIVCNILWINEFPDYIADSSINKRNLVVRLGLANARWGYLLLWVLFFVSQLGLAYLGIFPWWTLLAFLPLPLVIKAIKILYAQYSNPPAIIPAQGITIQSQLLVGILTCIGLIISYFVR